MDSCLLFLQEVANCPLFAKVFMLPNYHIGPKWPLASGMLHCCHVTSWSVQMKDA